MLHCKRVNQGFKAKAESIYYVDVHNVLEFVNYSVQRNERRNNECRFHQCPFKKILLPKNEKCWESVCICVYMCVYTKKDTPNLPSSELYLAKKKHLLPKKEPIFFFCSKQTIDRHNRPSRRCVLPFLLHLWSGRSDGGVQAAAFLILCYLSDLLNDHVSPLFPWVPSRSDGSE